MGTTLSSLHVYSSEPIEPSLGRFVSFSPGWQTMLVDREWNEFFAFSKELSKKISSPVLAFSIFDSDEVYFTIYEGGKRQVSYSTDGFPANTGIYKIPGLVGYPDGYKRRISEILSCSDAELLTAMLEEFFGVMLLIDSDFMDEPPESLARCRGEACYLEFHEQEKRLRGKHAPIRAVLTAERPGKIFYHRPYEHDLWCAPGYYLYGYDTPDSDFAEGNLRTVRFTKGRLEEADENMVEAEPHSYFDDDRFIMRYAPRTSVSFSDDCPDAYKGRTLTLPEGFFPFTFDSKDRLIIDGGSGNRSTIAYMTPEGKIIAKISIKGEPCRIEDDYLLTAGPTSFYAYEYDPKTYIRIYRLEDVSV